MYGIDRDAFRVQLNTQTPRHTHTHTCANLLNETIRFPLGSVRPSVRPSFSHLVATTGFLSKDVAEVENWSWHWQTPSSLIISKSVWVDNEYNRRDTFQQVFGRSFRPFGIGWRRSNRIERKTENKNPRVVVVEDSVFSIVLFGDEALWKSGIKYETFILFQAKSDSYGQGRLFFPSKTHGLSIGLLPPSSKQEEELLHQQKKKHGPASLYSLFHGSPLSFHSSFAPSSQIFKSLQEVEKKREREEKQKIYRKEKNLFLFLWRAL